MVGRDVEQVVRQLEGQADVPAVDGRCLDLLGGATREQRAETAGRRDQRCGLATDDAEVVLDGRVEARDVGRQGAGAALHLHDLALAQLRDGLRHDPGDLDTEVGRQFGRPGEQVVTGQDADGVVPAGVRADGAASGRRLVDDVVVVERRQVHELDDHAGLRDLRPACLTEVGAQRHQHGAEALAAGVHEVAGGLLHERVAGRHLRLQLLLDLGQRPGDRQAVGLELVEDGLRDRELHGLGGHWRAPATARTARCEWRCRARAAAGCRGTRSRRRPARSRC